MKRLFLLIFSGAAAFATPLVVGPIYLSGSGQYEWDYGSGSGERFSVSGTNGTDTVSVSVNEGGDDVRFITPTSLPTDLLDLSCSWSGTVQIDNFIGYNPCFPPGPNDNAGSWSLENVRIYNPSNGDVLAIAEVIGFLQYTNVTYTYFGTTLGQIRADFVVVPTPELATWILSPLGVAVVVVKKRLAQKRGAERQAAFSTAILTHLPRTANACSI